MILILGGGLAGLSVAKHLENKEHLILEQNPTLGGHVRTDHFAGLPWDEGPHISFTKSDYVKGLFAEAGQDKVVEQVSHVGNFYFGSWIDQPAQVNLFQAPQKDRDEAVASFVAHRTKHGAENKIGANYGEWLINAFGEKFAELFPRRYTRKYWTVEPEKMGTAWIGDRVYRCPEADFIDGAKKPPQSSKHYISHFRYPTVGGFETFLRTLKQNVKARTSTSVSRIDLKGKVVTCGDGSVYTYDKLISTLPLPTFLHLCPETPVEVLRAANNLLCTSVALVDVVFAGGRSTTHPKYHWWYVYNETFFSTRISSMNQIRNIQDENASAAYQVEVYYSKEKFLAATDEEILAAVQKEVCVMTGRDQSEVSTARIRHVKFANVVFTLETKEFLNTIYTWLETQGLKREHDDLAPITDWKNADLSPLGSISLAGRYGQWKYFWTDDCVLRGQNVAKRLS